MMPRIEAKKPGTRRPLRVSVRLRITLWYVALLAVALIAFGGAVYLLELRRADVDLQRQIEADARTLAGTYSPKDGRVHPDVLTGKQTVLLDRSDLALLVARDGAIVQTLGDASAVDRDRLWMIGKDLAVGPKRFADFTRTDATSSGDVVPYRALAMPVTINDQTIAWLVLAMPRSSTPEGPGLLLTLLIIGPLTLLASAAGGYWMAARAMLPLQAITRAAAEIGEGDLSRRLNLDVADELGELARTFDEMLDRLEAAFERQRQFTADASHELRTPLSIVDLEVSRALAVPRSAVEYRRALTVIRTETDYMTRVMNGLLTLARADAARMSLGRENLDLSDLALEAIERLLWLARRQNVKLEVGELPELPVLGDRVLLAQMLVNLVENAVKYTGGVGTRVGVSAGAADEDASPRAWVRVEDDGPGIASEHLPRVFDRFYRVDRVRGHAATEAVTDDDETDHGDSRGSGLGLAIGRWIARAHGGDIRVASVVDSGSVFEVWLPLAPPRLTRGVPTVSSIPATDSAATTLSTQPTR